MRAAQGLFGLAVIPVLAVLAWGCGNDRAGRPDGGPRPDAADGSSWVDAFTNDAGGEAPDAGPHVIRVTTTSAGAAADGECSLAEALAAAGSGTTASTGDCPAAAGADVIELPPGTYQATAALQPAASLEIRGAGMAESIILFASGSGACAVAVATPGTMVRLTGLTLLGPGAGGTTGVCVTAGGLRLRHARVSGFDAGGLRVQASAGQNAGLAIYNSLVDNNTNPDDGGGVAQIGADSALSIDQSSIVENTSGGAGGGILAAGGSNATYIINTTLSGNAARRGGGVAARIPDLTYFGLYWSTVAGNHALEVGGGLHLTGTSLDAHGTVTSSIVVANAADGDTAQANLNADFPPGFSCTTSIVDLSALAQRPLAIADSCPFDVSDVGLGPLMDMGGADHLPIHALLPGSPAIDAVDGPRPSAVAEERDGWNEAAGDPPLGTAPGDTPAWTLFGDASQDSPSDMGAYELHPRLEAELLSVTDGSGPQPTVVAVPDGASHGAAATLLAIAAGDFVTYAVPVPEPGRYAIAARIGTGSAAAMFQLLVGEAAGGPFTAVGGVQDGFSSAPGWATLDLGNVDFSSSGRKLFKLAVTGRRNESGGYGLLLDYLTVTRQ